MKKSIFIVFLFSILLNFACTTDETCTQTKYVKLTAGFYHVNDTTFIASAIILDSLTIQGLKLDTVTKQYHLVDSILYNKQNVSSIDLPLNTFSLQSKFRIKYSDSAMDTISIYHQNFNDYLSLECGCIEIHSIDTVTSTHHFIDTKQLHYIDSIKILNHNVNTINAENIRLYYK